MSRPPMILISRRARHVGVDWRHARSWLGGAPRLGGADWPRDAAGKPLHFLAQIDLAEIAATCDTPLPKEGSLAFFVGGKGAALFVPDPQSAPPSLPPPGASDLTNCGGAAEWKLDREGRALFPYWPIDFTRLDVETPEELDEDDEFEAVEAAQRAAIEKHFNRRQYRLFADAAFAGPPIPDWWRCAIFVSEKLAEAVKNAPKVLQGDENMLAYARGKLEEARRTSEPSPESAPTALDRLKGVFGRRAAPDKKPLRAVEEAIKQAETSVTLFENRIARLQRLLPGLKAFAAEVADWTRGRDPWSLMDAGERAQLEAYWARLTEFPEYTVHYGLTPLDYLKTQMFKTLPDTGSPDFTLLPEDVRAVISGRRAPHPQWWLTVIRFAEEMQEALARRTPHALNSKRDKLMAAGKASELAHLDAQAAAFRALASEIAAWTKDRDPLRPLADGENAELSEKLARFDALREIASAYYVKRLPELERATLVALSTAADDAYATLPERVRELINRQYLLPTDIPHQMFGQPVFIQGDASAQAEEGKLLLLQLGFDDMMFWDFGDNGAYTFWISPDDLVQRNWSGVTAIFECH